MATTADRFPIYVTAEQARTIERALLREDARYTEKIMEYGGTPVAQTLAKMRDRVRQVARVIHE